MRARPVRTGICKLTAAVAVEPSVAAGVDAKSVFATMTAATGVAALAAAVGVFGAVGATLPPVAVAVSL